MRELLRICLLPFVLSNLIRGVYCGGHGADPGPGNSIATSVLSSSVPTTASFTPATSALGSATCLSRTANYITHTLPQQCLRTDRLAANATLNSTASVTQAVNATTTPGNEPSTSDFSAPLSPSIPTESASNAPSASISQSASTVSSSIAATEADPDGDSPLDNANFLSFEEWKKQNLAKSGQLLENVGQGRNLEGLRERPGINNALEAYGEEGEIDIDFSGFGGEARASRGPSIESRTEVTSADSVSVELTPALRSKDAGKTCKERTNYASFDCAANVLKTNPECRSSSSVLVENKDSYMLNTCSANNKFFIMELCDNILIDTIVLANYEFFSSIFRHFRVSVSDRYPVKTDKWEDLGTFEARNVRDVQAFLVERPQIWARYLRIEFLSHYGSEYYCPVSLLRVHGTTMLEDYRHQEEEVARRNHGEDEVTLDAEAIAGTALAQEPATSTDEAVKQTLTALPSLKSSRFDLEESATSSTGTDAMSATGSVRTTSAPTSAAQSPARLLLPTDLLPQIAYTCAPDAKVNQSAQASSTKKSVGGKRKSTTAVDIMSASVAGHSGPRDVNPAKEAISASASASCEQSNGTVSSAEAISIVRSKVFDSSITTATADISESASAPYTDSSSAGPPVKPAATSTATNVQPVSTNSTRHPPPSSSVSAHSQPATQESFYKSVHKRLQQLESNSTLSLQYIEEQSRILRDAFSKVERRQIASTTSFLSTLNSTVMAELQGFRAAYDQLWQSTVIELEGQREQYQREMLAMGTRLTLVADELVWQKRMGIVQSTLLLLCLGLVLFARQGNGYLEVPLMQQMMHRSQAALSRAGWESPPISSSPNDRSPVSLFRRKLWRSHTDPVSGNVTDATDSRPQSKDGPEVLVAPPTPPLEAHDREPIEDMDDELFEEGRESRSGPATPTGTRDGNEFGERVEWLDPGASGTAVET